MRYHISHTTYYTYEQPVILQPHTIRLRPRSDSSQTVESFSLTVTPVPKYQSYFTDLDGNELIKVWFDREPTLSLTVHAESQVATHRTNPFDYLLEPWATHLPIDYPASLLVQLKPYLVGHRLGYSDSLDPVAAQLAQEIWLKVHGNPAGFLSELNAQIYKGCQHLSRDTGDPFPPGLTWTQKAGSCRDFSVLFTEVCRAIGLAARFVSGYQEGDPDNSERHLHAWAEVYLPGAGWRGYDPTQGLAVADRHITLVTSSFSRYAAPIAGTVSPGGVHSTMSYELAIQPKSFEQSQVQDQ
ncbi:transglutaminase family protein [Leptodesmis sp.]|uniref:transglutaminase family protein n=1 Tax=Leptodesmis sp. TaxID=3100501 RepID=UPI0040534972